MVVMAAFRGRRAAVRARRWSDAVGGGVGTKLAAMPEPGWGAYGRWLGAALSVSESIPCRSEVAWRPPEQIWMWAEPICTWTCKDVARRCKHAARGRLMGNADGQSAPSTLRRRWFLGGSTFTVVETNS